MELLVISAVILLIAIPASAAAFLAHRFRWPAALPLLASAVAPAVMIFMITTDEADRPFGLLVCAVWLAILAMAWRSGQLDQAGRQRWARFVRLGTVLTAFALLCLGTYLVLDLSQRWASRRAYLVERQARAERREADARSCIAQLARRSPEADAAADRTRGDATPIGITHLPHDPGVFETIYPEACRTVPAGHLYEQTGKWIDRVHTGEGDWAEADAPSSAQCQRAHRTYIDRYNRRMATLAPAAMERFCASLRQFR